MRTKAFLRCCSVTILWVTALTLTSTIPGTALAASPEAHKSYLLWMRLSEADREAEMEAIASAYVYGRTNGVDAMSDASIRAADKLPTAYRERVRNLLYNADRERPPDRRDRYIRNRRYRSRSDCAVHTLSKCALAHAWADFCMHHGSRRSEVPPIIEPADPTKSARFSHAANCVSRMQ